MRIPLSAPDITELEIAAVTAVLRTPTLSLGPQLRLFEQAFATHTGMPHAIGVSSGTAGLHLAVRALGLGPNDEVIVPSFTFIAAANCIRYEGATPVFCDIEPDTLNADPQSVAQLITPRTRALLLVHTFGRPAAVAPLLALARAHGLSIIEDACEALGATTDQQPAGSFGDISVFAFYPNKQVTTGEGGMVLARDPGHAARIRAMRNQGRYESETPAAAPHSWLHHQELGYNYRLSELACALGLAQLSRLPGILSAREHVASLYRQHLAPIPSVQLPAPPDQGTRISPFVYVVRVDPQRRDPAMAYLRAHDIGCAPYFAPIHQQPAYSTFTLRTPLPITQYQSSRTIALPFHNRLTEGDVEQVAATLAAALQARP